jgi:hypothetical protein
MSPELVEDLLTRYPAIFACNRDWSTIGLDEHYAVRCGDGWFGLVDATCQVLQELAMRTYENTHGRLAWMPRAHIYTDPGERQDQGGLLRFDLFDRDHRPQPPLPGIVLTPETHVDLVAGGISWMATDASGIICEVCGNAGRRAKFRVRCIDHRDVLDVDVSSFAGRAVTDLIKSVRPKEDGKAFVRIIHPVKRHRPPT